MIIKYFGHSCFSVISNDYTIVLDPFKDVHGFNDIDLYANEVICSHGHGDHNYVEGVKIESKNNSPFTTKTISVFHDECNGNKRGLNNITILTAENKKIVHLGDLGHILSKDISEELYNTDVLMIPVGGFYTIDYKQAVSIIKDINPKYVIPMHYRDGNIDFDVLEDINSFINLFADKDKLLLVRGYEKEIEI